MKQFLSVGVIACATVVFGLPTMPTTGTTLLAQQLPGTVNVPSGADELGMLTLPRRVMANGSRLDAGDYSVHLTGQEASPDAVGALSVLERWVEFRQDDDVKGREVVSIVPASEIGDVAKTAPPGPGSSRVEMLRGDEFLRVWINQDGTSFLIHLSVG